VRFPQPPPPAQNGQKRNQEQAKIPNGDAWKDPKMMEKKIQKIHERQCKKNMMSSIRAAAAAGQPLESLLNNFHTHFNRMMAPEGAESSSFTSSHSRDPVQEIPIQHADGTVTCNGATVTTTTTSSSASGEQPTTHTSSSTVQNENAKVHTSQEKTSATDEFEDVTAELKQQKMKEAIAKMNELGFVGEWVEELLKSVDYDVVRAVTAMNPEK